MEETIHEIYQKMSNEEKNAFTMGRLSVLEEFETICKVDAFVGFSEEEFKAVKKFFAFNKSLREKNNRLTPHY